MIEELYKKMFLKLFAYALGVLNDRSLAEEAVQDTFRIACTKACELDSSENRQGWLLNTLKNVIRNMRKSQARAARLLTSVEFDEKIMGIEDDSVDPEILYEGLINKDDYKLLKMIALEGYSMLEVSRYLGISLEACKKRFQRAKQRLRDQLEGETTNK